MDIHKAIQYLQEELRDLDRLIDAIEGIAVTYCEKRDKGDFMIESAVIPPENRDPANEICLHWS